MVLRNTTNMEGLVRSFEQCEITEALYKNNVLIGPVLVINLKGNFVLTFTDKNKEGAAV